MISFEQFESVEICVGTIIRAEEFPKAKKPALKLWIDFGSKGIKKSSAQITGLYSTENLPGRQVIAVINLHPRQVADFLSECLCLGIMNDQQQVVLLKPDQQVPDGTRIT